MNLKKGQVIDLEIKSLAFGGKGIGKYEGLTVFVAGVIPGDKVKAAFTRIKKNFAEASLTEITSQSKDRIKTKCPYSGICGGCHFQFLKYEKQLEIKKQHVIDSLERIGKIKNPPVDDIIGCKNTFYYRNKMEFSFGYDEQMNFALGMHLPGRKFDILDLKECHLESLFSVKIVNAVREFMKERQWPPFKYSNGEGFLKNLFIREGKRTGEVMIDITSSDDFPADFEENMDKFIKMLSGIKDDEKKITSIYWSTVFAKIGVPKRIEDKLIYGKKTLSEKMILENGDELDFEILPQAFFQVNTFQAEILYSQILKFALEKEQKLVFDLFCGTGTIGLFLAKHVEQVLGIEINLEAVKMASGNAQKNRIFNIDFYTGDTEKILSKIKMFPSLIVLDPPRVGLTKKLIQKLNTFNAKQLIYVSCNPATFARDYLLLAEYGYRIKTVQPVDMFPHSYHIETVALLER